MQLIQAIGKLFSKSPAKNLKDQSTFKLTVDGKSTTYNVTEEEADGLWKILTKEKNSPFGTK